MSARNSSFHASHETKPRCDTPHRTGVRKPRQRKGLALSAAGGLAFHFDLKGLNDLLRFVILDERWDSINDGYFVTQMDGYPNPASTYIVDYPASYHCGACGFAFADGHSEFRFRKSLRPIDFGMRAGTGATGKDTDENTIDPGNSYFTLYP